MKKIMNLSIYCTLVLLFGCTNPIPKGQHNDLNINLLTRVDVQRPTSHGSYEDEVMMVTNNESIQVIRNVFKNIKWERNVDTKISRHEDVKATFFYTYDENMPELLTDYYIWFDELNQTAIVIEEAESSLGTIDEEHTLLLKELLLSQ
ncbi:hypothetical protein [Cytobacillus sp. IB215316]|uniref:hypothetical protein n=1 Tax=Cytobacillus sp. IB215316 TaxID=3097354 RepID=UPI002A10E7A1|nr:hypothetical protein [Cytobacillus sp. IB215316]MDX8360414.1 hypothetical protein [Cytobacillus sp. IB215316]